MRIVCALCLLALITPPLSAQDRSGASAARPVLALPLARGRFTVYDLPPPGSPAAVLVFVSGANGWSYWEDVLCRHLSRNGLYVLGVDLAAYAAQPYTPDQIASDLERIAAAAGPGDQLPILYGGVRAGAAQALLAALPPAPARLQGLLLVNPPARGRCGTGLAERLGLSPRGAESFLLAEKARGLGALPVAAAYDAGSWFAAAAWLDKAPFPHRLCPFTQGWGHFLRVDKPLADAVDAAVEWLLHS